MFSHYRVYSSSGDFANEDGQELIMQHHINAVGLGIILGDVLPQGSNMSLDTSQLKMIQAYSCFHNSISGRIF